MAKMKFVGEYEFRASQKMLFPYISTPYGLSQWFADDVYINDEEKGYTFIWDSEEHRAKMVSLRTHHHVKFEFLDDDKDPSYLEMCLEMNEITQEVFLEVTDYSDIDAEEAGELWDGLIHSLKEIVGA